MSEAPRRILVTSALPYANGPVHFGHIAGAYLPADIFVRFQRLRGHEVLYICGTDEHGVAITLYADQAGVSPREHVDRWHEIIKRSFERANIRFDHFSRTTRPVHAGWSVKFFRLLHERGALIKKSEAQYFDSAQGRFLPDRYLVGTCYACGYEQARGDECPKCGKWIEPEKLTNVRNRLTGSPVELRDTVHWYLALDQFQKRLEDWLEGKRGAWKPNVLNKLFNDELKKGLRPRPITRDLSWGIPVPLDDPDAADKVLYVWFDAPIGYISSLYEWGREHGIPDAVERWWRDPAVELYHFIGKDNIPFHCLTFPAVLMGVNDAQPEERPFNLPTDVPANEFLNLEGRRFSTGEGWFVDLDGFFDRYPADLLRWNLARCAPENQDADFTWDFFAQTTNRELADVFGNLATRVIGFAHRYFNGVVPALESPDDEDRAFQALLSEAPVKAAGSFERFQVRKAAGDILELGWACNRYLETKSPWKTRKNDPQSARSAIALGLEALRRLSVLLWPIIPDSAAKLRGQLGLAGAPGAGAWARLESETLTPGSPLGRPEALFVKLEEEQIAQEVAALKARAGGEHQQKTADPRSEARSQERGAALPPTSGLQPPASGLNAPSPQPPPIKPVITYEDFAKLDLRVGKVLAVEKLPNSKKLYRLEVDLGVETRQILAGVQPYYTQAQLQGATIIVLANLAPRKMAGSESQGMMLAVVAEDGAPLLIRPIADCAPGRPLA